MKRLVTLALAVGLNACGGAAESGGARAAEASEALPPEMQKHLHRATAVGRILHAYDQVAAEGTDVMQANADEADRASIGGYLVEHDQAGWAVVFFTRDADPQVLARIRTGDDMTRQAHSPTVASSRSALSGPSTPEATARIFAFVRVVFLVTTAFSHQTSGRLRITEKQTTGASMASRVSVFPSRKIDMSAARRDLHLDRCPSRAGAKNLGDSAPALAVAARTRRISDGLR